jgi:hypothetical protein
MAVQNFNPNLDFTAYSENREFECNEENFGTVRNGSGTGFTNTACDYAQVYYAAGRSERDPGTLKIQRGFLRFDLSDKAWSSSATINSAKLILTNCTYNAADIIVNKPSAFDTAAASVFNNISTTYYSSEYVLGAENWPEGIATITLNSTAATDLLTDSTYIYFCIMENDNDASGEAAFECESTNLITGWSSADAEEEESYPKLEITYTAAATDYDYNPSGMDSRNLSKVIDVATANIDKIIGL